MARVKGGVGAKKKHNRVLKLSWLKVTEEPDQSSIE